MVHAHRLLTPNPNRAVNSPLRPPPFARRAVQRMGEIWGHGDHVQCIHPGANCIAGREQVGTECRGSACGMWGNWETAREAQSASCVQGRLISFCEGLAYLGAIRGW